MSTPEDSVQPEVQSVPFGRALIIGGAKILIRVAFTAIAVQALYALGWGFAKLIYAWRGGDIPPPTSIWIGAQGAKPLDMIFAGVICLIMLAATLAAVVLVARIGGWRGTGKRLFNAKG